MLAKVIIENGVKKVQALTADTGTGNPVGTIIPMYKKSSPSGYLYCDGSTFDETAYPLLYAYLGSNVLPDYREFALVGAEQNTTSSVIATHDVFTQGEEKDDQIQDHEHGLTLIGIDDSGSVPRGVGVYSTSNGNTSPAESVSGGAYGTLRKGTVTRGKSKAVFIYIKATSGLSENAQDNVVAQIQNITVPKPKLDSFESVTLPASNNNIQLSEGWYSLRASTQGSYIDLSTLINGTTIPVASAKNNMSGVTTISGELVYLISKTYVIRYTGTVSLYKLN